MKIAKISMMVLGAAGAAVPVCQDGELAVAAGVQEQQAVQEVADADRLYDLVQQARADLRRMRVAAGLGAYAAGPSAGRDESRERGEGAGEHGGREGREGREGRGAGDESGGGEDEGAYVPKMTRQNKLFANGARLVLEFDPGTEVFVGSVTNTTARTLSQVRVEVHLDNGTELGPTKRIDVGPGQTIPVELGAFGNDFSAWVSHPEAGVEAGHGGGGEEGGEGAGEHGGGEGRGEGAGEHGGGEGRGEEAGEHGGGEGRGEEAGESGGGEGARPRGAAYRPVYNQLQILRGEIQAFEADLAARSRRGGR